MYLAIDIGGTKTLLALFSLHGACLKKLKFPTEKDPRKFEKELSAKLQEFLPDDSKKHKIRAITVAIPGVVTHESNSYSFKFGNLDWPKIDLTTPIKNLFNSKIFFVNDANLATLYEASRQNRKSGKTIYLTFSTGIGGGIVSNGKLTESSGTFEPGHVKYIFNGLKKEWEDIASAKALVEAYNVPSLQRLSPSKELLGDLVSRVSLGLSDIVKNESPDTIIIGGPLAFLFRKIKKPLLGSLKVPNTKPIQLKKARRPTDSTIYGAYLYAKQNDKE